MSVGTTSELAAHFRGGDTIRKLNARSEITSGDPELIERWQDVAWPSAAQRNYALTALPSANGEFTPFPGIDIVDVYRFLERQRPKN